MLKQAMQPLNYKREGRLIGLLLLAMIGLGIVGLSFRGLGGSLANQPDFLQTVRDSAFTMRLSILLNFVSGLVVVAVSLKFRDILRSSRYTIGQWIVIAWILQFCAAMVGDIAHLLLVDLSDRSATPDESVIVLGSVLVYGYYAGHWLSLILFSIGMFTLNAFHVKTGLIPKWLAIWGMVAPTLVTIATVLQIFGKDVSAHLYNQNGIFVISYTIYHLVFGFRKMDLNAQSKSVSA
jgi:hypothetical protein